MKIHKLIWIKPAFKSLEPRYLCNWAVEPTPEKASYQWKNVNCKNCLRERRK